MIVCRGRSSWGPGRFIEDGLKAAGVRVETYTAAVDFSKVYWERCAGVLFVEGHRRHEIRVYNLHAAPVPKVFWVHHGRHRLELNLRRVDRYQPDLVLLAHSLEMQDRIPVPVRFFPFAVDPAIFNRSKPLAARRLDVAFAGSRGGAMYTRRERALSAIYAAFHARFKLKLDAQAYLKDLADLYGDSKIVVNGSMDDGRHINMRLFEGMGCGALVLTDRASGQERLFQDGAHLAVYEDATGLLERIDYFLQNLDEAQRIASAGRAHLLNRHTYRRRAEELLRVFAELGRSAARAG